MPVRFKAIFTVSFGTEALYWPNVYQCQGYEDTISFKEKKVIELKAEASSAIKQVHQIAEKDIEGASHAKAFTLVREIALEQVKKHELLAKADD